MTTFYEQNTDDIGQFIIDSLESETKKKVFTMRVIDGDPDVLRINNLKINALVVFDDKSILEAEISIITVNNKMAARIKGNYM
jgi:hypothetical protein